MLHFAGGVTLGVLVGNFLVLQCALKCGRIVKLASEIERTGAVVMFFRDGLDVILAVDHVMNRVGNRPQRFNQFGLARGGEITADPG